MLPPLHRVLHFVRCLTVATIEKKQPIVRSFVFFEPHPNILQLCLGGGWTKPWLCRMLSDQVT